MTQTTLSTKRPSLGSFASDFDIARILLEGRAFFALIAIIVVFSLLSPYYFSLANFLTMASHVAIFGILAVGMLLVILNGGIDLSVGSTLGLCGVVAGFLMQGVSFPALGYTLYPPVWAVVILTCALGGFVGLINGVLVARFKVPAFVATLGVMYVARGVALLITERSHLQQSRRPAGTRQHRLQLARLQPPARRPDRRGRAGGGGTRRQPGPDVAPRSGGGSTRRAATSARRNCPAFRSSRCRSPSMSCPEICAAIAGLILSSQLTSAGPTAGVTYELTAIAAVVIGGAALTGGRGTVRGTLLGAFVIGFLSDGLVIIGISSYWQTVFTGAVIVLAVLLNAVQYRRRASQAHDAHTRSSDTRAEGGLGATGRTGFGTAEDRAANAAYRKEETSCCAEH